MEDIEQRALIIAKFLQHLSDLGFSHMQRHDISLPIDELAKDLVMGEFGALELVRQSFKPKAPQ